MGAPQNRVMGEHLPPDAIGQRIRSGVAWKAASQTTVQLSRMVVAVVLAHVLAPGDWGIAAMVLVFSGFVVVFTDNAFGTALVQRHRLERGDRSTIFWFNVILGLALAVGGIALSGPLADWYGHASIRPLFAAVSVGFFVSALGTTQVALLARDMRFRRLELRQIAATLVGAAAGLTIAFKGFGPWAIVGQQLAEAATSTALLWCLTPWLPSMRFSTQSLRRLGSFAGYVFGENLLYQAGRTLPTLVMGRYLVAAALGWFAVATNVILVPFTRLGAPLQQVFFPAFSRMNGDRERIADVWIRATRLIAMFAMPALTGLVIVAPVFVPVVLGRHWIEDVPDAVLVLQVLAWVGLVQSVQTLNGEVLLSLNRARTLFRFTAFWFVVTVGAFALGLHWGILGVAVCYALATTVVEPIRAYITTRALGIPLRRFLGSFSGVAQATAIMAVVLLPARQALIAVGVPAAGQLAALVLLGTGVFTIGCMLRAPEVMLELRRVLRGRRQQPPTEPQLGVSTGKTTSRSASAEA